MKLESRQVKVKWHHQVKITSKLSWVKSSQSQVRAKSIMSESRQSGRGQVEVRVNPSWNEMQSQCGLDAIHIGTQYIPYAYLNVRTTRSIIYQYKNVSGTREKCIVHEFVYNVHLNVKICKYHSGLNIRIYTHKKELSTQWVSSLDIGIYAY